MAFMETGISDDIEKALSIIKVLLSEKEIPENIKSLLQALQEDLGNRLKSPTLRVANAKTALEKILEREDLPETIRGELEHALSIVKKADNEAKIQQAIAMLIRVVNDTGVPRNIRRAATEAIKHLRDETLSPGVRAANAVGVLDEVSQDPNMPIYARITLWNVVTLLETVKD